MNNNRSITIILVILVALIGSLMLGVGVATAQKETMLKVGGALGFIVCLLLGKKIWLLVPFFGAVQLTFLLPGQPTAMMVGQLLFVGFSVLLFLTRRISLYLKIGEIEIWIVLLTLCVLQGYVRHPVGIAALGGSQVGGKPYAIYALALVTATILIGMRVPEKELRLVVPATICGGLLSFGLSIFGLLVPQIGVYYGAGTNAEAANAANQYQDQSATRIGFLGTWGRNLSLWISSFVSPLKASFHPLYAPLVLISFAAAAGSGFRNVIGFVGLTFLFGIYYRNGIAAVLGSGIVGVLALIGLILVNEVAPLPANVQRSLSFLPGNWDQQYLDDTEGSTEWRTNMWEAALLTDDWIENKFLGDGLGISQSELRWMRNLEQWQFGGGANEYGGLSSQQQLMMIAGDYHSGPVSTIRTIGYLGLAILVIALLRVAVHAHRQIRRATGTPWMPLTLLIGLPAIVGPIFWLFIFGSFTGGASMVIIGGAMIRLLEHNLPLPTNASQPVSNLGSREVKPDSQARLA